MFCSVFLNMICVIKLPKLFLICWLIHTAIAASFSDITRLRRDLLNGYDPHSRPVQNHNNATVVKIIVNLIGFQLDERASILILHAETVLVWQDEHMQWDPARYGNITYIQFAAHELWKPDLTVYNNLGKSEIDHFGNTRLVVYNTSKIVWVTPAKFQVGCTTNLRKWPYDTQGCFVVLGSWAHDGSKIDIQLPANKSTMELFLYKGNRDWNLDGTYIGKRVNYYDGAPGVPFIDIIMNIYISRKSPVHTTCIVAPGLVLAWAVLLAFWLPPGTTERLSILLMAILINVLYLYYIYKMIPNNGDSIPLVLLFYRDSLVMLAFALVWTISLRYLAQTKRQSPVPLPGFVQSFLESIPAKILCLDPRPSTGGKGGDAAADTTNEGGENTGKETKFDSGVEKGNPFQQDWAWLAHLLDRVLFVIYLVIYTIFYSALL